MAENHFQSSVNASCAHPQLLKGRSIFAVSPDGFVCGEWNCGLCLLFIFLFFFSHLSKEWICINVYSLNEALTSAEVDENGSVVC